MNDLMCKTDFPLLAGILLGLGLGGFFDGIVLHQLLQWHHMLTSAAYPATSVHNLQVNTFWDGVFHTATYACVVAGLVMFWRAAQRSRVLWPARALTGSILIGFGIFNLVEGLLDHHILKLHHVNETVPPEQWIYWDIGFLLWGAAMLLGGRAMLGASRRESLRQARPP